MPTYTSEKNVQILLALMKKHKILQVLPGSAGEELDIRPGDFVISVNGREIEDIFDYNYFCETDHVDLLVETADGEEILYDIDKDEEEDLGLVCPVGDRTVHMQVDFFRNHHGRPLVWKNVITRFSPLSGAGLRSSFSG